MHSPPARSARAGREGLISLTGRYLAGLVAHDPGAVPLAPGVRTVENLHQIAPGEGLWATATGGADSFALYVPDPERQEAGFLGLIQRDGEPVLLGLRLRIADGQITEAEHLVASNLADSNLTNLQVPRPGLLAEIPPRQRLPADGLRRIGATYYDALVGDDASVAPFAGDCGRHENGLITAAPDMPPRLPGSAFPAVARGCAEQINSKVFRYIKAIDHRRVFAADPVTGLVMGLSQFRHPMDNVPYEVVLADGSTMMFAPEFAPFDLPAAHIWKVGGDRKIHEIEAMGFLAPLNSPAGW